MIGLMVNMMVMEWKHGPEVVDIGGNINKDLDMDLGCICFIQEMFMLVNGLMAKAMVVEFINARMGAGMLVNSSGVSSMDLGITISGNFHKFHFVCCLFFFYFVLL